MVEVEVMMRDEEKVLFLKRNMSFSWFKMIGVFNLLEGWLKGILEVWQLKL